MDVSNKILLNAAAFELFIEAKTTGGELHPPLPPTQLIVKILSSDPVKISQNCFYSFNCSTQIDIQILKFPFPLDK